MTKYDENMSFGENTQLSVAKNGNKNDSVFIEGGCKQGEILL
jgi:hypothetical protein